MHRTRSFFNWLISWPLDYRLPIWILRRIYPTLGALVRAGMARHKRAWAVLHLEAGRFELFCLPTLEAVYIRATAFGKLPRQDPSEVRWTYRQNHPAEDNPRGHVLVMTRGSGAWFTLVELDAMVLGLRRSIKV